MINQKSNRDMKRTNKFRGLRKDGKGWAYGVPFEIKEEGICFIIDNCQSSFLTQEDTSFQGKEVIPETVGQYAEKKDRYRKEVYEGDVIVGHTRYNSSDDIEGVIVFDDQMFCLKQTFKNKDIYTPLSHIYSLEVIGNIHEKGCEK